MASFFMHFRRFFCQNLPPQAPFRAAINDFEHGKMVATAAAQR
jgi:hypothetical protein